MTSRSPRAQVLKSDSGAIAPVKAASDLSAKRHESTSLGRFAHSGAFAPSLNGSRGVFYHPPPRQLLAKDFPSSLTHP